jgi:hypothetical protein
LHVLIPEGWGYADQFLARRDETTPPEDAAQLLRYAEILYRNADRLHSNKLLAESATLFRAAEDWLNLGAVLVVYGATALISTGLRKRSRRLMRPRDFCRAAIASN